MEAIMIKKFAFALGVTTICSTIDPTSALPRSVFSDDKPSGPRVHKIFKSHKKIKTVRLNKKTKMFHIPFAKKRNIIIGEPKDVSGKTRTRVRKQNGLSS